MEQTIKNSNYKLAPPVINALPLKEGSNWKLADNFKAYYKYPAIFYKKNDPYDDWIITLDGARGSGKTTAGVGLSILDGQMRGIPVISNVPIEWTAWDSTGRPFIVQSIPFDVVKFTDGDDDLYFKHVFLDEANYNLDRLRSTSRKNLEISDILQQARKFRMTITLATINSNWIDGRATYMSDIAISVKDVYNTPQGRKHGIKKGVKSLWSIIDISGKKTGVPNHFYTSRTFNNKTFWETFNTYRFIKPKEERQKRTTEKMIIDESGNEIPASQWYANLQQKVMDIPNGEYSSRDWWEMIGIQDDSLKLVAGRFLSKLGIQKSGYGKSSYLKELSYA